MRVASIVPGIILLCVFCHLIGCSPIPPPIVDTEPIGEGLRFIGIAAVIVAIIMVIGAAVVDDLNDEDDE